MGHAAAIPIAPPGDEPVSPVPLQLLSGQNYAVELRQQAEILMEPIRHQRRGGRHGLGIFVDLGAGADGGFIDPIHQRVIQRSGLEDDGAPGFDPHGVLSFHQHRETAIFHGGGSDALLLQAAGEFAKKLIVHVDALLIYVG